MDVTYNNTYIKLHRILCPTFVLMYVNKYFLGEEEEAGVSNIPRIRILSTGTNSLLNFSYNYKYVAGPLSLKETHMHRTVYSENLLFGASLFVASLTVRPWLPWHNYYSSTCKPILQNMLFDHYYQF